MNIAGHIKLTGQIGCRLWLYPKATVQESSGSIKEDLLRSMAARLEMHWDSLIEEEHGSPEGYNFKRRNVNEIKRCFFIYYF